MDGGGLGRHLLLEFHGCDGRLLDDLEQIRTLMLEAARLAEATIVTDVFHRFNPHGLRGVVVIAESHLAIHTWPEHGVASVDLFTCGSGMKPERIEAFLGEQLGANQTQCLEIARGKPPA